MAFLFKNTYSPITLANISSINLVSIFRCSSSPNNPVYPRRVDFSDFVFSLSSYRHLYIGKNWRYVESWYIVTTTCQRAAAGRHVRRQDRQYHSWPDPHTFEKVGPCHQQVLSRARVTDHDSLSSSATSVTDLLILWRNWNLYLSVSFFLDPLPPDPHSYSQKLQTRRILHDLFTIVHLLWKWRI